MTLPGFSLSDDPFSFLDFLRRGPGAAVTSVRTSGSAGSAAETEETAAPLGSKAESEDEAEAEAGETEKAEPTVKLSTGWVEEKVFFNSKATAEVKAELPAASAHLTRVQMTLFALGPDGKREKLASQDASLSGGKATCEFTAFIPSFKENGEPPKACDFVFVAKHSHSKETESPPIKGESRPMAWLRLKLEAAFQGPLANRQCTLKIAGESHDLVTDANGVLAKFVPADADKAEIQVKEDWKNPALTLSLAIDTLAPPGEPKGARDRLDSMGYFPGPGPDAAQPAFRKALEEFQCDSLLSATGELDGATGAKLKEAFGC